MFSKLKYLKRKFNVSTKEAVLYFGFFAFFALFYYTTLWFNRGGRAEANNFYFSVKGFLNWGGIDYILKMLLSIPVWWLMFRKLRHVSLFKRLLLHFITLPLFVFTWIKLYYFITESLRMYHLVKFARIWDVYITALFYVLEFGILHAYVYFKQNQEKLEVEAQLREAALKSELSSLKAQLNPHFLYNVFNTINASLPPGLEKTRQMIAELSDLFRYQLRASKSELVPLKDELEFTLKYLDLEKARYAERLQIDVQADEELMDELIPPMLLQPIAENAVKHGISTQINGGKITIQVKRKAGQIEFCVTDTGKGIKDKSQLIGKGIGLTNTELRLNKMYHTSLNFTDTIPHGLTVNFLVG